MKILTSCKLKAALKQQYLKMNPKKLQFLRRLIVAKKSNEHIMHYITCNADSRTCGHCKFIELSGKWAMRLPLVQHDMEVPTLDMEVPLTWLTSKAGGAGCLC